MHRPKKKKARDPLLPEREKDVTVDERHLIDTEESADLSFEDRVRLYWMENKTFVTGCITALAIAILLFQGIRLYGGYSRERLREAFAEARAEDTLDDFARARAGKNLGGFAALEVADAAYEAEEYARAAEFYALAADALADTVLAGRARMGHAFAVYHNGAAEAGLAELNAIAADGALPQAVRAEAAYHLALDARAAGRDEAFQSYADQVRGMSDAGPWSRGLDQLAR